MTTIVFMAGSDPDASHLYYFRRALRGAVAAARFFREGAPLKVSPKGKEVILAAYHNEGIYKPGSVNNVGTTIEAMRRRGVLELVFVDGNWIDRLTYWGHGAAYRLILGE